MNRFTVDGFIRTPHPDSEEQYEPLQKKTTENGNLLLTFRLTNTRKVKKGDEWVVADKAFFKVAFWNERAKEAYRVCVQALQENRPVVIEGSLYHRSYQDADGVVHWIQNEIRGFSIKVKETKGNRTLSWDEES